jgi:hypothetical protein
VILTRLISQTIPFCGALQIGLDGPAPPAAVIAPHLTPVRTEKNNKLHVNK